MRPKNKNVNNETELSGSKEKSVTQKVTETVERYGETFDAEKLIPITGSPHIVWSAGAGVLTPFYDMLDQIIAEDFKIPFSFTVDPRPFDFKMKGFGFFEKLISKILFSKQKELELKLKKLGSKNDNAFTCACYLPEVGNIPEKGDILCWSESSAVVYANSVLGPRTNRNSGGIDILCNVLGKVPLFGLLTDEGRKASVEITIETKELPDPQMVGSYIGLKVQDKVPYITGLADFFKNLQEDEITDYLKDMGAASAATGAVGLYHVESITPEAIDSGRLLLNDNF